MGGVAKELGLVEQTLRNWVKAAAKGTPNGVGSRMVTPEERELSQLRAENARLKRELEIVKKRRRTSRGMPCEVRLDGRASAGVCVVGTVRCMRGKYQRGPSLEARRGCAVQAADGQAQPFIPNSKAPMAQPTQGARAAEAGLLCR